MPVPGFQSLMLPLLKLAGDGKEHSLIEADDRLATQFGLSDTDKTELLPSGTQSKFYNRVRWAATYLRKAQLIESPQRGHFRITRRGAQTLGDNPSAIDVSYLMRFPEFVEFRQQGHPSNGEPQTAQAPEQDTQTPEEVLESSYQQLRSQLAQEILDRVKNCSPKFFEHLVVDLLVAMGYGGSRKDAGQAVGQTGDAGIDGIIKEDKLGLDVVYIQAKRWEGVVGRPVVQAFAGSLEGERARKGVLITTSHFSPDAISYVRRIEKKIVLIDGEQLAQLMIEHGVGVNEVVSYTIKRVDADYFEEQVI
ncbi:MAG: restriction endonuclease [Chloroflexi bacterium]|nr:restriction endonuclease [Chloroflexota bacterium]